MIETTAAMAIVAVCFCAVLIQSMAGFGSAMLAMGILTPLVGLEVSGPLVALVALTLEAGMLVTLRSKLSVAELAPLILGSFVAIPIGVWVTVFLDEDVALAIIGWLIFAYVACATFGRAPKITGTYRERTSNGSIVAGRQGAAEESGGQLAVTSRRLRKNVGSSRLRFSRVQAKRCGSAWRPRATSRRPSRPALGPVRPVFPRACVPTSHRSS